MKLMYLAQILDSFNTIAGVGVFCSVVFIIISFIAFCAESDEGNDTSRPKKLMKKSFRWAIFFCLLLIFCPSKREVYEIYGIGKTLDYLGSNEKVQQLPDKAVDALNAWLDDFAKRKD